MFRDGPLTCRPPEVIRYGTGRCALGSILVAVSEQGIAAIVIRDRPSKLLENLKFPKARLIRDEQACKNAVKKVIGYVAAPVRPFQLPLDLRGTPFQIRVWEEVRRIPIGASSSYTKIADAIGAPKAIRAVAGSCSRCMHSFAVPCHRVLHKDGEARDANGKRRLAWVAYEAKLLAKTRRQAAFRP